MKMISRADIQDLHDRPAEELRELAAHVAGALAEREGGVRTAEVFRRIAAATDAHMPRPSP